MNSFLHESYDKTLKLHHSRVLKPITNNVLVITKMITVGETFPSSEAFSLWCIILVSENSQVFT
jgi:hypothetical protein